VPRKKKSPTQVAALALGLPAPIEVLPPESPTRVYDPVVELKKITLYAEQKPKNIDSQLARLVRVLKFIDPSASNAEQLRRQCLAILDCIKVARVNRQETFEIEVIAELKRQLAAFKKVFYKFVPPEDQEEAKKQLAELVKRSGPQGGRPQADNQLEGS
jgi:hypothetical protein